MNKRLLTLLSLLMLSFSAFASEYAPYSMPRTHVIPIQDTHTKGAYELYVKLPESYYEDTDKYYPVIYFTDAVWHIEILSAATGFLHEDVILVGISWQQDLSEALLSEYGQYASRFTDYSFWQKSNPNHPLLKFGGAEKHARFVREQVFAEVEKQYRTDLTQRTYFGYSLGGLFGAYILVNHPEAFNNYIIGSPSVGLLMAEFDTLTMQKALSTRNVYIAHGDQEDDRAGQIVEFVDWLSTQGKNQINVTLEVIPGDHQTAFPSTGIQSIMWLSALQN